MKIKLFVSHRVDQINKVLLNDILTPVYCGAVYKNDVWQEGVIGDNSGDNISNKRISFCELTVQYWAWKNIQADYYGLCHYRRYFSFGSECGYRNEQNQIYVPFLSERCIEKYRITEERIINDLCGTYDAILPEPALVTNITPLGKKPQNVFELWLAHEGVFFDKGTIDYLIEVIRRIKPDYYEIALEYLYSDMHRGYNCYLMRKELYDELCNLQFQVMFEIEKSIEKEKLNRYPRTIGYIGEILFGVFQYRLLKQGKKIKELPLVFFENTSSNISVFSKFKIICKYKCKNIIINQFPEWGIKIIKKFYHFLK